MTLLWILIGCVGGLLLVIAAVAYVCFRLTFYVPRRQFPPDETFTLPNGKIYEPYRELLQGWAAEVAALPCTELSIRSYDGLILRGKYYESNPGGTVELMMHGYRGDAKRDLCGGVQRCFAHRRNALIVDQRGCGWSEGNTITFGVKEQRDCLTWIEKIRETFGENTPVILTGISMGAATVMMTAGKPLPDNVVGVLADCGYTSASEIVKKVIKDLGLPPRLAYPFVRLGARLYGGFNLEENPPVEAMKRCQVPVLFIHGEADKLVPLSMSRANFDACTAKKRLLTVPEAGHGLSYPQNPDAYLTALEEFFGKG